MSGNDQDVGVIQGVTDFISGSNLASATFNGQEDLRILGFALNHMVVRKPLKLENAGSALADKIILVGATESGYPDMFVKLFSHYCLNNFSASNGPGRSA